MFFNLEQMQACAFGALRVWKEDGCFYFARMTQALEDAFGAVRPGFNKNARSTTDCRLDFHTDSLNLRLDAASESSACKIEVYVDGVPALYEEFEGRRVVFLELPEGEKRITIALPCHSVGRIYNLSVDEHASIKPHRFDHKLLFLGDSITQGWKTTHDSMSFAGKVARWFNAESLNWAVGGSWFDPTFVEKTEFDPEAVIIAYGTNDYSARKDITQFTEYCRAYLQRVKALYGDKKVFVLTPIWRADHTLCKGTGTLLDCSEVISREAEACGFTVLDGFKLFPHSREYMADGYLHPNDLGFAVYADNLIKALTPYI